MIPSSSHNTVAAVLSHFMTAISNVRLYGNNHPLVSELLGKTHSLLSEVLETTDELTLFLVGDDIIVFDQPIRTLGQLGQKFSRVLRENGIERITFAKGFTAVELLTFASGLARNDPGTVRPYQKIKIGRVEIRGENDDVRHPPVEPAEAANETLNSVLALRDSELEKVREVYTLMKHHARADARPIAGTVMGFIDLFKRNINPINLLASVKHADEYTFTHVVNVALLTIVQAKGLGFSGSVLHQIGVASLLHDIGKLFIPEEIIGKPGKLSPAERTIIETHTLKGARFLLESKGIPKIAAIAAVEHHLKFSGGGYPHIGSNWRPHLVAQMIAISDVFDAMRSRRVYSEPKPIKTVLEILVKESGTTFNPVLVSRFLSLLPVRSSKAMEGEA
jgi:HD-GYP domain-containing protein (c-di-GMP phosphodiesterase class II)